MANPKPRQTRADREYILANLPQGTKRVQVITSQGKQHYKRPDEVDLDQDEIVLANDGTPVVMRGKPGRPRITPLNPVTPQIAEVSRAKDLHLEADLITQKVEGNAASSALLDAVLHGIAKEAASLEFERKEAERNGQDTSNISTKRARVLKAMADTILKKQQLESSGLIDMDSPAFQTLFIFMMETFKEAMNSSGIRSEAVETVFQHLVKSLKEDSWKEDAKRRMKEKIV